MIAAVPGQRNCGVRRLLVVTVWSALSLALAGCDAASSSQSVAHPSDSAQPTISVGHRTGKHVEFQTLTATVFVKPNEVGSKIQVSIRPESEIGKTPYVFTVRAGQAFSKSLFVGPYIIDVRVGKSDCLYHVNLSPRRSADVRLDC